MKLLIVFHSLYSLAGGVDNRISELEINLPDNINREYLLFKDVVDLPHKGKINNIKTMSIPKFILKNKNKIKIITFFYGFLNLFFRIYKTRKFIKSNKFRTILAVDDYFSLIVLLSTIGLNIKIVCSVRNNWDKLYNGKMIHLLPDFMYTFILAKLMNKYAFKIHCVSNGLKEILINKYNINNTISIYNLFNKEYIRLKANEPISGIEGKFLVNVGHLNSQKNHKDLILSYNLMCKDGITDKLVIVGDGPLKKELESLVESLNLKSRVIFVGKQKNPYKYLKNASIYVSSSLYEGLPAVFVESLILELPIVSYAFECGSKELASYTVEMIPSSLKDKVMEVMLENKLKENAIIKGNDILNNKFNSEKIVESWVRLLS